MNRPNRTSEIYPTAHRRAALIGPGRVVVLVVAAAAPLAALIGNMPLALSREAGLSMPGAFALVGLTLACFAVGYTALSREIVSRGAFYTQVGQGLGRPAGVVAAYAAAIAYAAYAVGTAAGFGYFAALVLHEAGIEVSWLACAAAGIGLIGLLGYRSLDLSAKLLTWLLSAEFAVLLVFEALVIAQKGLGAFPPDVWSLAHLADPGIGAVIPFAIVCFVGFEAVALYGEETRDPRRAIPQATYAALGLVGVFYLASVWIIIGAAGPEAVRALAQRESGNFLFTLATAYGGEGLAATFGILLVLSILASFLAVHNAASRYVFALASDRLLPTTFARFHPDHHSPHVASIAMTGLETALVIGLGLCGVSPYLGIASSMIGLGTIGIIAMQIACALAVIGFFRTVRPSRPLATKILPAVAALGLTAFLVLVTLNYGTLTGTDNPVVNSLPWLFLPLAAVAVGYARWLKRKRPGAYAQIAATEYRPVRTRAAVPVETYRNRYCIVGAGPSGLIMARALLAEGVPFDCFERHGDVGGLWDPDNPGTPIYESAHFISSKWTSYFYGFPMPEHYPDYPSCRQILDYIRSFARAYGLYEHVTLNTAVTSAEPAEGGWRVTLSTGEVRRYAGVIACPGVTWHPNLPEIPGRSAFRGEVLHSVAYTRPQSFAGKRVLVVGAGNSGVDIACDAAKFGRSAFFSVRRGYRFIPKHLFGVPTDLMMSGQVPPPRGIAVSGDVGAMLDTLNGDLTRLGLPKPDHDALSSHPIMNTQILHHLSHGDLIAKPDIAAFRADGVVFRDGSEEAVDVVVLATGYVYAMPFFDPALFAWNGGRPQLYLNVLHRQRRGLYVLGFTEFADAAYRRFDEMAQLIVADIHATETGHGRDWLDGRRRDHFPDLRGGRTYVESPRHTNYVHTATFRRLMSEVRRRLGWPDLDDASFEGLRRDHDHVQAFTPRPDKAGPAAANVSRTRAVGAVE
ncbi:MAG: NAD(P)-binding domain-containing protein [Methylorubrum populi]